MTKMYSKYSMKGGLFIKKFLELDIGGFDMKYKISEVANLLDITPEAVRYYESKGIITPTRSESTGYRYYGGWEIHMLIRARTYRQLGYSLEEIERLLNEYNMDDIVSNLSEREEAIKEEIIWKKQLLDHIEIKRESLIRANELIGKYRIQYRPEIYRLEMQDGYVLYPDKEIQSIIIKWIDKIPFVFTSTLFPLDEINKGERGFTVGLGIYKNYAKLLGIVESEYIRILPSELCIETGIQTRSNKIITPDLLIDAIEYMNSKGMKLSGDVVTRSALMRKIDNEYVNWQQAWLPFNKE